MDRKELRLLIPHGYCKTIAEKAGVRPVSVSKFFRGKTNSIRIETAALELVVELNRNRKNLENQIR